VRDFPRLRNLVRNGDGQLLIQDVAPMEEPFIGERLMQAFRAADRNGDGQLSVEESAQLPGLHSRFGRFDRNGDGLISIEELLWFRRSLAPRRYRQSK
jgi:Ca2+-binding EF-hand superfamily protein